MCLVFVVTNDVDGIMLIVCLSTWFRCRNEDTGKEAAKRGEADERTKTSRQFFFDVCPDFWLLSRSTAVNFRAKSEIDAGQYAQENRER